MNKDRSAKKEQPDNDNEDRYIETDSDKIIHRHLKNKDDIITDDDIRSIRVGVSNETVLTGAEAQARFEDEEEPSEEKGEKNETDSEKPSTPWDVIK